MENLDSHAKLVIRMVVVIFPAIQIWFLRDLVSVFALSSDYFTVYRHTVTPYFNKSFQFNKRRQDK